MRQDYFKSQYHFDQNELALLKAKYTAINNAYIAYIIGKFMVKSQIVFNKSSDSFSEVDYNASVQKGLPFFGGDLNFNMAIDGLSRFLAKRIKQELTTHAIKKNSELSGKPKSYQLFK